MKLTNCCCWLLYKWVLDCWLYVLPFMINTTFTQGVSFSLIFGSIVVSIPACHHSSRATGVQFPAKEFFFTFFFLFFFYFFTIGTRSSCCYYIPKSELLYHQFLPPVPRGNPWVQCISTEVHNKSPFLLPIWE